MKTLITFAVVAFLSTTTFAQDTKTQTEPVKQTEMKEGQTKEQKMERPANAPMKMRHECYMMQEGKLMHCMGDKSEVQKGEVKLRNGVTLAEDGTMKTKEGGSTKLENGQCVTMIGRVGDCDQMHARMRERMNAPADKK